MTRKEKQLKKKKDIERLVKNIIGDPVSQNDPLGSYTGNPVCEGELPDQDADDL